MGHKMISYKDDNLNFSRNDEEDMEEEKIEN